VLHRAMRELREDFIAVSGFFDLVREARERGELNIPRDRLLFFSTPRTGEVLVNTTRVPADHPQPRLEGLRQVRLLADWMPRNVPGFERATLGRVADDIGERESSRLVGRYALSVDDLASGRQFDDAVARGCFPIDIHSARTDELTTRQLGGNGWYDIPLRSLQAPSIKNLLVAGRCISADSAGFASARTLPTAMATGQACGMLAGNYIAGERMDTVACISAVALV
nr:FAD-dependent oxidoreductase [bacterium]